ncbi:30S ribosomal protein S15 [Candidatus Woesearchaeota archaeon]|nr:30S ribosomal protein S15 [Candidatus Woesearchaeota archaeon]
MAKMHSRKKGKSGSNKPSAKIKRSWNIHSAKEVEQLVIKLAKAGNNSSGIGLTLRDSYGIPDVKLVTNKKITQILEENKLNKKLPDDLIALIKKDIKLMKHIENNKKDMTVKRGLILTESKINRLAKYYKRSNKLPVDWTYDRSKAKLLIE